MNKFNRINKNIEKKSLNKKKTNLVSCIRAQFYDLFMYFYFSFYFSHPQQKNIQKKEFLLFFDFFTICFFYSSFS